MEERLPASLLGAVLWHQGQERVAGFLGPAGDLGEKRPADPAATISRGDGHRVDERLLAGVRLAAFVVPEVAVELELGDPDETPVELGHDDVQVPGS